MKNHLQIAWMLVLMVTLKATCNKIEAFVKNNHLYLTCKVDEKGESFLWTHDTKNIDLFNKTLDLGSVWNDPRGNYVCKATEDGTEASIEVFVRMCQNCIEMDTGTISGFIIADIIMIGLIAIAVYCVSGSETRRPARASDKQNLLQNDLYQPLGQRSEDTYSHLNSR
ncbi:CD3g molecule S homeolog precursor [Xenopus laevis]|nr:CD3g molecule S homeolog precursor [Xenopus laevis]AAB36819.1 CD3gamma/delta [Xenopus laevis]AAI69826.1 T-cell surface glycoprotein CD3 gamma/delta chain homolog [Xenopus laevis]AAI70115.1 T-cell surface glycoprotein CD3 gamma/delta chain homolog [Xenopus laevis]CAA72995.1 cd3 [Xenopus laevis]